MKWFLLFLCGLLMLGSGSLARQIVEIEKELQRTRQRVAILEEIQGFSNAEGPVTKPNLWWARK